jgi:hypothetical protein
VVNSAAQDLPGTQSFSKLTYSRNVLNHICDHSGCACQHLFFYRHQISCCLVAILLCLGVSVIFFSFYSFVMFCCHTIDLDSTCLLMPFDFDPPKRAKRYTISSVLTKRLFDVAISLECSPPINSFFSRALFVWQI